GLRRPRMASRSEPPHAAKPWARLLQPSPARTGPSARAADTRSRYADRVVALRSMMRWVTWSTTGCTATAFTGTGRSWLTAALASKGDNGHGSRCPRLYKIDQDDRLR